MDPTLRKEFNAAFTEENYRRYLARLEGRLGLHIPFRVAETPLFLADGIRHRLQKSAREIVDQLCDQNLIERMKKAIPANVNAPGIDALSSCIQVDFAISRDEQGDLTPKLVELQGFPSLYCLMVLQTEAMAEELASMGMGGSWTTFFGGISREAYVSHLRDAIIGGEDPGEVVLLDLEPDKQKTFVDFVSTKILLGIDAICPTELEREGKRLFRRVQGRRVQVKRIYNRIVFDELDVKKMTLPFAYTDDLDVSWCPHPNWYWIWSKYTMPHLSHPSLPKATYVSELAEIPADLTKYVLKPLFSFAGSGVKVDVTRADIDAIPKEQRGGWLLQEKIEYVPAFHTPDGNPVKAEVRMMFLRAPSQKKPELVMNLVRLSRGKMLGVDQNKDLSWVGGTVGIWPT